MGTTNGNNDGGGYETASPEQRKSRLQNGAGDGAGVEDPAADASLIEDLNGEGAKPNDAATARRDVSAWLHEDEPATSPAQHQTRGETASAQIIKFEPALSKKGNRQAFNVADTISEGLEAVRA